MLVPVKPDEEVIAARLLEFLSAPTPWHRRLWNTSLLLGLHEVLEAAEAARASVLSEESVKATASTCVRLAGLDPGLGGEQAVRTLQHALTGRLRYDGLDYHTVSHITEDLESHYLQRWADAIRGANPPKLERTARSIAAHLLDLGFGPNYLHRWWTYKIAHEATEYSLADVVEEAHTLARRPIQAFQVLLAFQSSPRSRAGYPPDWLTAGQVSAWLAANNFAPAAPGIKGGLIRVIEARDPDTAAELAGEFIDNLTARASVGTGDDIDATQHVWVAGERGPTQLNDTGASLPFLAASVQTLIHQVAMDIDCLLHQWQDVLTQQHLEDAHDLTNVVQRNTVRCCISQRDQVPDLPHGPKVKLEIHLEVASSLNKRASMIGQGRNPTFGKHLQQRHRTNQEKVIRDAVSRLGLYPVPLEGIKLSAYAPSIPRTAALDVGNFSYTITRRCVALLRLEEARSR